VRCAKPTETGGCYKRKGCMSKRQDVLYKTIRPELGDEGQERKGRHDIYLGRSDRDLKKTESSGQQQGKVTKGLFPTHPRGRGREREDRGEGSHYPSAQCVGTWQSLKKTREGSSFLPSPPPLATFCIHLVSTPKVSFRHPPLHTLVCLSLHGVWCT
jgi:hypothetical protein